MDNLIITYRIADAAALRAFEAELNKIDGIHIFDYGDEKMAVIDKGNFEEIVATLQKFADDNSYEKSDHAKWIHPVSKPQCANHTISNRFF